MNICILYYDGFCEFEVAIAACLFRSENIFSAALQDRAYTSEERQRFLPDTTIDRLKPEDIDLFIIPGGKSSHLYENEHLRSFITELNERGKYIGAICAGTYLLASYGLLEGRRCTGDSSGLRQGTDYIGLFEKSHIVHEDVVVDGNIVTSTGQAYVEFAFELGRLMGVCEETDQGGEGYRWYKNIKEV